MLLHRRINWGLRDYGVAGQLGLEPTPEEYVARMVEVFREVRRVLRKDGTLWLNMGDCYAAAPNGGHGRGTSGLTNGGAVVGALKPKDLVGQPWRLAFALQADGWWLRQDIIWAKPNPMPESVTDRCTKAHEYLFLLTKSARYFYDAQAIAEPIAPATEADRVDSGRFTPERGYTGTPDHGNGRLGSNPEGSRNARSVWTIATAPFAEAHFATFPPDLARRCIAAGTSEKGRCATCGAPRVRVVESRTASPGQRAGYTSEPGVMRNDGDRAGSWTDHSSVTLGWRPSCSCDAPVVPCTVLDPFAGAGTTLLVADRLGRDAIGIELNPNYVAMAEQRIRDDAPLFAALNTEDTMTRNGREPRTDASAETLKLE